VLLHTAWSARIENAGDGLRLVARQHGRESIADGPQSLKSAARRPDGRRRLRV